MVPICIVVIIEFFAYYFCLLVLESFSFRVESMLPFPTQASLSGDSGLDTIW